MLPVATPSLAIVNLVQSYGKLPLAYLAKMVGVSLDEAKKEVTTLQQQGVVRLDDDDLVSRNR